MKNKEKKKGRSCLSNFGIGLFVLLAVVVIYSLQTNPPAPAPAPVREGGSRAIPYPSQSIQAIRDGNFQVNALRRDMTAAVYRMNRFNSEPEAGQEWVLVSVTFYCTLARDAVCNTDQMQLELVGAAGQVYDTHLLTVLDNKFGGEVFGSGQVTGDIGFIVGRADTDLLLIVKDRGRRTFFATN